MPAITKMRPKWARHQYGYGWVCHCGYHGKTHAGREVHNRRAARGLGCKPYNAEVSGAGTASAGLPG